MTNSRSCFILITLALSCTKAEVPGGHPWASFAPGSWVDVHTFHRMATGEGEPSVWESDSRITVVSVEEDSVILKHLLPAMNIHEEAVVPVPAVDALPGVRALGQWPHDIFPFGPERASGLTPRDKNPFPENVRVTVEGEGIDLPLRGRAYRTVLYLKEWDVSTREGKRHYVLKAWVAPGVELPLKQEITSSNGVTDSSTELVSLEEQVKLGERKIPCVVTVTRKRLSEGWIMKKRWSSKEVPGFMVKMESRLEGEDFTLEVNEWITDYRGGH